MNGFTNFLAETVTPTGTATCTVNGQPASCGEAGGILAVVMIPLVIISLISFVFWVIALIHLLKHDDVPNRIIWIVLLLLLGGLVGIIYFFMVKRPYDKQAASGAATPQPPFTPPSVPPASPSQPGAPQPPAPQPPQSNNQFPPQGPVVG